MNEKSIALLQMLVKGQENQSQLLFSIGRLVQTLQEQAQAAQQQQQQVQAASHDEWKASHPELAAKCYEATNALGRVQAKYIQDLTEEILENEDNLVEGGFSLREFIDQHGMRLTQLNGMICVLSQLQVTP